MFSTRLQIHQSLHPLKEEDQGLLLEHENAFPTLQYQDLASSDVNQIPLFDNTLLPFDQQMIDSTKSDADYCPSFSFADSSSASERPVFNLPLAGTTSMSALAASLSPISPHSVSSHSFRDQSYSLTPLTDHNSPAFFNVASPFNDHETQHQKSPDPFTNPASTDRRHHPRSPINKKRGVALERNRVAASKSRQKKKAFIDDLQSQVAQLETRKDQLRREHVALRNEHARLTSIRIMHYTGGCRAMGSWSIVDGKATLSSLPLPSLANNSNLAPLVQNEVWNTPTFAMDPLLLGQAGDSLMQNAAISSMGDTLTSNDENGKELESRMDSLTNINGMGGFDTDFKY